MAIVTVGVDLAKNVFAVHGVDELGKPVPVRPEVPRAKLPPCLISVEACSGAHHLAREFAKFGHTVLMMAPKFVEPYRMSGKLGKNDAADAAAICEAVTRPNMRFVLDKTLGLAKFAVPLLPKSRIDHKNVEIPVSNQSLNLIFSHLLSSELNENRQLSILTEY